MKKIIYTKNAPEPLGPYSQGVLVNDTLFASGQIAINPKDGSFNTADITMETKQVMENLSHVLSEAGMGFSNVIKCTIFLKDMGQFSAVNEVYATYFGEMPPARETVEVSRLPKDVNVEISLIAMQS